MRKTEQQSYSLLIIAFEESFYEIVISILKFYNDTLCICREVDIAVVRKSPTQ